MKLSINDRAIDPQEPFLLTTGLPNTLSVEIEENDLGGRNTSTVTTELTAPDGRTTQETKETASGTVARFPLGLLLVPAVYEYEDGVTYRKGYNFAITISRDGKDAESFAFHAGCSFDEQAETFYPDHADRTVLNDGLGTGPNKVWNPWTGGNHPLCPAVELRLHENVLIDQDDLRACLRLRINSPHLEPIRGRLVCRDCDKGALVFESPCVVKSEWQEISIDPREWDEGGTDIEFVPDAEGISDQYGPLVRYNRKTEDSDSLLVSPMTPFILKRDPARDDLIIKDFTEWVDGSQPGWEAKNIDGNQALARTDKASKQSFVIRPNLAGHYAVFAKNRGMIFLNGGDGIVRCLQSKTVNTHLFFQHPIFMCVANFDSDTAIEVFPSGLETSALVELRVIAVTEESVDSFQRSVTPKTELRGISDWWCYFQHLPDEFSHIDLDQLDNIMRAQREAGLTNLSWAVGRSWAQYPSKLPDASVYPCIPIEDKDLVSHPQSLLHALYLEKFDCLGYPLSKRKEHDVTLYAWLGMNRHYSYDTPGWRLLMSQWARNHPELHMRYKNSDDTFRGWVEYYFEETRRERLAMLKELAEYKPDGITLGWCRQPPHMGYAPEMVEDFKKETGIDPLAIDYDIDREGYLKWIQWRCDHGTTILMRELRKIIGGVEKNLDVKIPIVVRIPCEGFLMNLAMGMDTKTWIVEKLVDEVQLDSLYNFSGGVASEDITPYIDLCRKHGTTVIGAVNVNMGLHKIRMYTFSNEEGRPLYSPIPGIKRAMGLIDAGVDGIECYESEQLGMPTHLKWLIPLWGDKTTAERFVEESNLEAVYPVSGATAFAGCDNHWSAHHSMVGLGPDTMPRGTTRLL